MINVDDKFQYPFVPPRWDEVIEIRHQIYYLEELQQGDFLNFQFYV